MQDKPEIVTIKVWESSRQKLRIVAALTGETQQDVIERLLEAEIKKSGITK